MVRTFLLAMLGGGALALAGCGSSGSGPSPTEQGSLAGARIGGPFTLTDAAGRQVTEAEVLAKPALVYFGYTFCPDVCPTTLAQLAGAQKQWASLPEASRPRVLFVSADPDRDSPRLTGDYARAFHSDTLAATAPVPQLEAFARSLSLVFMKSPGASGKPDDYTIDHSAALVVLDPQARMAGVVQPPFDVKGIASDLAKLSGDAR